MGGRVYGDGLEAPAGAEGVDVFHELLDAIRRCETEGVERNGRRPDLDVAVTTDYRKRILRRIGWDENRPVADSETVFGHRVIVDDNLATEPGFAIRKVGL